jgi:hypothetical protein
MINSIKLNLLRNGEFIQLMTDLLAIVSKKYPAALKVAEPFNVLKVLTDHIETLFKIQQGSVISDELIEIDARRDNAINGISSMINAFTYSTDANLKKHAVVLQTHLSAFGNGIARDNYQSETASIRNILTDWDAQTELTSAINALQLVPWKTELAAANTLFSDRYLARAEETGAASSLNIGNKRLETNEAWYALRDLVNAYATIEKGAEPYGSTITYMNVLLEYYNNLIGRRGPGEEIPTSLSASEDA